MISFMVYVVWMVEACMFLLRVCACGCWGEVRLGLGGGCGFVEYFF